MENGNDEVAAEFPLVFLDPEEWKTDVECGLVGVWSFCISEKGEGRRSLSRGQRRRGSRLSFLTQGCARDPNSRTVKKNGFRSGIRAKILPSQFQLVNFLPQ